MRVPGARPVWQRRWLHAIPTSFVLCTAVALSTLLLNGWVLKGGVPVRSDSFGAAGSGLAIAGIFVAVGFVSSLLLATLDARHHVRAAWWRWAVLGASLPAMRLLIHRFVAADSTAASALYVVGLIGVYGVLFLLAGPRLPPGAGPGGRRGLPR